LVSGRPSEGLEPTCLYGEVLESVIRWSAGQACPISECVLYSTDVDGLSLSIERLGGRVEDRYAGIAYIGRLVEQDHRFMMIVEQCCGLKIIDSEIHHGICIAINLVLDRETHDIRSRGFIAEEHALIIAVVGARIDRIFGRPVVGVEVILVRCRHCIYTVVSEVPGEFIGPEKQGSGELI